MHCREKTLYKCIVLYCINLLLYSRKNWVGIYPKPFPYLHVWPQSVIFPILLKTRLKFRYSIMTLDVINIIFEELSFRIVLTMVKKYLILENIPNSRLEYKNHTLAEEIVVPSCYRNQGKLWLYWPLVW